MPRAWQPGAPRATGKGVGWRPSLGQPVTTARDGPSPRNIPPEDAWAVRPAPGSVRRDFGSSRVPVSSPAPTALHGAPNRVGRASYPQSIVSAATASVGEMTPTLSSAPAAWERVFEMGRPTRGDDPRRLQLGARRHLP